ncbi:MAG TPA: hypothetical protein VLD36_12065 [Burkholderiales bacterium]|nr:hypothetical protein [Burkholderiales bacterium]
MPWCAALLALALAIALLPVGAGGETPDAVEAALAKGDTVALRDALAVLSRTASVDAAAAAFAAAVDVLPRNREFTLQLDAARATPPDVADARSRYLFVMVPGWRYRVNFQTGADLARPRAKLERLGFASLLVPLDENGTIEANAQALAAEITRLAADGRALILVSTSKGGPEAHLALDLARRSGHAAAVAAWVNIGGLLNGSAIADNWAAWPRRWLAALAFALQGFDIASIDSMTTAASRARFAAVSLPANVLVVNYVAVPMSWEVSPPSQGGYAILADHGPNDGLTLLADAIVPEGVTVVARGLDHFYAAPDLDERIAAMAQALVRLLEERAGR